MTTETVTRDSVIEIMKQVYDPEIPVNVVDLGLVYGVEVSEGDVHVLMTLTAPGMRHGPHDCSGKPNGPSPSWKG